MADKPSTASAIREIRKRLADYDQVDAAVQRDKLVKKWREHHPEAAQESSRYLHPLMLMQRWEKSDHASHPDEEWHNDVYAVSLRRHETDPVFGSRGGMIQLGISSLDGSARHDWRDFQAIKNQLAGPEAEAFELYPAESRLLDPSNYYTLWCFPGMKRIKVGQLHRVVLDADEAFAPQRRLPQAETDQ